MSTATTSTTPRARTAGGCAPKRSAPATSGTLTFGGVERRYLLHIPPQYDGAHRVPLVVDIHGHGSSATAQIAYSGIGPVADELGLVVVAPEGQGSTPHFTLLGATSTEADDAEFAVALVDDLLARLCVDPARVFAMGMSNGGALSSVLACRGQGRFAAVGAVAAMIYLPACDAQPPPVPIIGIMGTADPVVPFAGGRVSCCGNPSIPAAPDTMASFATRAGCTAQPVEDRVGDDVVRRRWQGCKVAEAVEFVIVEGGGHTWPGASPLGGRLGPTTKTIDATREIVEFFLRER